MIIDHTNDEYLKAWKQLPQISRFNGAYYYSLEIVNNIIPNVKTDRPWQTIKAGELGADGMIFFVHNNLKPERYEYLKKYKDIILVCGIPETCENVAHLGTPIYLPLSIDVDYVKRFKLSKEERQGTAFAGRQIKRKLNGVELPKDIEYIEGIERDAMLSRMATFDSIYAVGRTAIEAKALGCKLKAYDPRFPKVSFWKVIDNKDAAEILQGELNKIDG